MPDSTERQTKQLEITERLQDKLLEFFETKLQDGTLSDTGAATLTRLLMANGWSLDPARLPQTVRDKLTRSIDPRELDDDDLAAVAGAIGR